MISATVFVALLSLASYGLCDDSFYLFDFTASDDVSSWEERSDTYVLSGGLSKADMVIEENEDGLRRAVFFALLNPQTSGAGQAGYRVVKDFDLSSYSTIKIRARAQGTYNTFKVILRQDGENDNPAYSYQQEFQGPQGDFAEVSLPLSGFQAFDPTTQASVDGVVVDASSISSFAISFLATDNEQSGPATLEIDWISAE